MGSIGIIVIYVVALGLMMYFLAIKPQKKQQKAQHPLIHTGYPTAAHKYVRVRTLLPWQSQAPRYFLSD